MTVTEFKIEPPDSEGDRSTEVQFKITNVLDELVMRIQHEAFYFNEKGFLVASDLRNSGDCHLEKGDSETLTSWCSVHKKFLLNQQKLRVKIQARLFKREYFKIGQFKVQDDSSIQYYDASVKSDILENNLNLSVFRHPPDEDGEVQVNVLCGIRSKVGAFLEEPELKITLLDSAGAELDYSTSSNNLPPMAFTSLDPSLSGIKQKKLKGATVECSLTVFQQVGMVEAEKTVEL